MTTKTKANLAAAAVGATLLTVFLIKGPYHGDPIFTMRWTNANTIMTTCTNLMQRDWQGATSNQLIVTRGQVVLEPQRFFMAKPMLLTNGKWTVKLAWNHSPSNVLGYSILYGQQMTNVGYTNRCTVPFSISEPMVFSIRATNAWTNSEPATLSNLAVRL